MSPTPETSLAKLDKARLMLAESRTLPEVKKIKDIAEMARVYAKAANLGRESQNYAAEIALLAAHKAGTILEQLERDNPKQAGAKKATASVAAPSEYRRTLQETNTPERTAQHWQTLATIPLKAVESYTKSIRETEGEITTSGLLRTHQKTVKKPTTAQKRTNQGITWDSETIRNLFKDCSWLPDVSPNGSNKGSPLYNLTFIALSENDVKELATFFKRRAA